MKIFNRALTVLVSCLLVENGIATGFFDSPTSPVLELTYSRLTEITTDRMDTSNWVLLFYSGRCSACRRYAPEFTKIAASYSLLSGLEFGAINVHYPGNIQAAFDFNVMGFPTIYYAFWDPLDSSATARSKRRLEVAPFKLGLQLKDLFADFIPSEQVNVPLAGGPLSLSLVDDPVSLSHDATRALRQIFHGEVFRGAVTQIDTAGLTPLVILLELCSQSFELVSVGGDCDSLLSELRALSEFSLTTDRWKAMLEKTLNLKAYKKVPEYATCRSFGCAFWRLLHLFSLGRGGTATSLSPRDAMVGIRTVVATFFSCLECRDHFLVQFDSCDFGRCEKHPDTLNWEDVSVWLWRVHNGVTLRVQGEGGNWPGIPEAGVFGYLVNMFSLAGVEPALRVAAVATAATKEGGFFQLALPVFIVLIQLFI